MCSVLSETSFLFHVRQVYFLSLLDVCVPCGSNANITSPPTVQAIKTLLLPVAPCSVSVPQKTYQDRSHTLVVGSQDGSILRVRCSTSGGMSQPNGVDIQGSDVQDDFVNPWIQPHEGPVSADVVHDKVVSASLDGTLASIDLEREVCTYIVPPSEPRSPCGIAFTSCQWNSPRTCVTTSMQGTLQLWDLREDSRKSKDWRRSSAGTWAMGSASFDEYLSNKRSISSLAIHPADFHLCVTGDQGGTVAVWDLRNQSANEGPFNIHRTNGTVNSIVWVENQVFFGTEGGSLGLLNDEAVHVMYEEPGASIQALSSGRGTILEPQIFAATDQEVLLYSANIFA